MLIHSASQLLTITGGPQTGRQFGQLDIIHNGAVLVRDGIISEVGETDMLQKKYPNEARMNAENRVVMPGFVDSHTHLVWAGDRAAEFEMRLEGKSYMEIMSAGGGIQSTVNATRAASIETLFKQSERRALEIFRLGTTSVEAKSGYGLELQTELKQLKVMLELDNKGPLEIYPTFLGAHAIPKEFKDNPNAYVEAICKTMLPSVKEWWRNEVDSKPLPFVDVFCEVGVFNMAQTRKILEAAKDLGFPLKIHADEFENIGGASLAAELGTVSADHLVKTSQQDLQNLAIAGTIAVSLPCTPFGLGEQEYSPAQDMINAGCIIALASDLNPGTAWCGNMQFAMALSCRYMGLTPGQAIAASTINAAAAIGKQSLIGSIECGKQADMVILSVSDYRQLPYRFGSNLVSMVIKKGKLFTKEDLC